MKGKVAVVLIVLVVMLSGCINKLNTERGRGDAPVGVVDSTAKDVIQFPDRFSNVATACDGHGHRIYVTTQTSSGRFMFVVADPACGGAAS